VELFSERQGIKPKKALQIEGMDADLRTSLWNALTVFYWQDRRTRVPNANLQAFLINLWIDYFKEAVDTLDPDWRGTHKTLKSHFYSCEWWEVYDFVEFVANEYPDESENAVFIFQCNVVLEEEKAAYRFVGGRITPITSELEIAEIEEALDSPFKPVNIHLQSALDKLADRQSPDYRNSIKESISAVEAMCKLIKPGKRASTLKAALDEIESKRKVRLHRALTTAFIKLYGWTSDAEGIRHSLMDEPNLGFEDAQFMLVSCSAFVNYLKVKASKAGITL